MRLYCCYTPAHAVLFRDWFLPSVPAGFELVAEALEIEGAGDFLSPEFLRCIRLKLDRMVSSIEANAGRTIVWSDVDIRFFDLVPAALEGIEPRADVLFQREACRYADVNAGFVVIRCSARTGRFFARIREALAAHPGENEQRLLNRMLFGNAVNNPLFAASGAGAGEVEWGYLPWGFYARTHGWPPPRRLAIYHANYTAGADAVGQKIRQFEELDRIRRHPILGRWWSCARRVPGAFARRLGG